MSELKAATMPALAQIKQDEEGSARAAIAMLMNVIQRRLFIILLITGSFFAMMTVAVYMATPKYVATTRIKIDPNQNAMIGVDMPRSTMSDQGQIDTEVTVIQSREVALLVARTLKLVNDPEFGVPAANGLSMEERIEGTALKLLGGISVAREKSTYVVDINFKSANANKAAEIANSLATAYMSFSVGARSGTASKQAEFLEGRLATVGKELAAMEAQAAQYKAEAGIIGGGTGGSYSSTVIDQQVGSLSGQLATALSSASAAQAKLDVARQQMERGGLDAVSAVLDSRVVTDLRRQRAEVVREMGEIQARYGPRHPETIKVTQQLKQVDDQIDQEARRVMGGLASEAAAEAAKASTLQAQMGQLKGQQSTNTRAGVVAQNIQQQADAKREEYNRLSRDVQQSRQLSRNTQTQAQIVELALPPAFPSSPNKRLYMAFGLLLGLTASATLVTILEIMARGFRSRDEIENKLKIPFIVSIPRVDKASLELDGQQISPADLLIEKPVTPFGESFRVARNTMKIAARNKKPHVIALVSALPNEGKTASVLSMARMMAMSGDHVLLLDCDIRKAGLSQVLKVSTDTGMVELLSGTATFEDVIRADAVPGLDIVPVSQPTFSAEDLIGNNMADLLAQVNGKYDVVLIDTPPILGVADARLLASLADSVLMLIRWSSTPTASVKAALAALEQDRTPVSGAIFTMVDPKSEAIGAMYYSRAYSKYYQN
ncbi:GumC family protein [Sphingobium sp.]|uniref:GumC family protein n=1 Tax=Sphingobium sp. TaxID=1912891 RepID=UPI003B3A6D44